MSAPLDQFSRLFQNALAARGIRVEPARAFDFVAVAFGSRGYVKLGWEDDGIEAVVKLKSGVFSSPEAIERVLLEAGREAQARLGPLPPSDKPM